jgi:Trypsin-co-occurring domain 1
MMKIVPLRTSERHSIYVEMEELDSLDARHGRPSDAIPDQPEGSELTSAVEEALDAMSSLKAGLKDIAESIKYAIEASTPAAWKLEVNIGFKGKTSPIPIVLSGEANAALKLQIEWKR